MPQTHYYIDEGHKSANQEMYAWNAESRLILAHGRLYFGEGWKGPGGKGGGQSGDALDLEVDFLLQEEECCPSLLDFFENSLKSVTLPSYCQGTQVTAQ